MKKVGILTYHYSINEGAMLQAYALQKVCQNIFDGIAKIEIVNYQPPSVGNRDLKLCLAEPKSLKSVLSNIKRLKNVRKFKNNYFVCSPKFSSENYNKTIGFLNKQKYDLLIVGSDEVWKISQWTRKFPNIYWLGGDKVLSKKTSYAASANKLSFEKLNPDIKEAIRLFLKKYDLISVRDTLTGDLVRMALGEDYRFYKVLDPTFLYDFPVIDVKEKINKKGVDLTRPFVLFTTENNDFIKKIAHYFKNKKYQTVAMGLYNPYVDINCGDSLNPLEWAATFSLASFSVTDRFHGTIFSIKHRVPFVSIDSRALYNKIGNTKISSLLKDLNLEENIYYHENNADMHIITEQIEKNINMDFKSTFDIIDKKKNNSLDYLNKVKSLINDN